MVRRMFVMTGLLVLTGCSAFLATSQESYYHDERFEARRTADKVEVFRDGTPRSPYVVLGRLSATQGMFGTRDSVLTELKTKAAQMGADALISVSEFGGGAEVSDATTHYQEEGNVSTSESWQPPTSGSIRLTMSALAIRYRSP